MFPVVEADRYDFTCKQLRVPVFILPKAPPAGNRLKLLKEITNQPLTSTLSHTHTHTHVIITSSIIILYDLRCGIVDQTGEGNNLALRYFCFDAVHKFINEFQQHL